MASLVGTSSADPVEVGIYISLQFLQSLAGPLIPSEAIAAGATVLGMDIFSVTVLGAIGATLGNLVNYLLAKRIGRRVASKVTPRLFRRLETIIKRYGILMLVLVSMVPVGLSEVVSYFAGLLNIDMKFFISLTYLSTLVRVLIVSALLAMLFA